MMDISANMKRYPKYKDSGVEWLGEIPEGWEVKHCRDYFRFSKGLTITKENLQESGIACLNYGEIHSKYPFEVDPDKHPLKYVDEKYLDSSPKSLLSNGDFIFADTSEDIEGSGNFSQLISEIPTFAGYHTVIIRQSLSQNGRYIAYLFDSISFRKQVRKKVKGVKVYSITQSLLKSLGLLIPSKEEQAAIASFLDDKVGKIDEAIAQKEQLIQLLGERKQIIIQNAVTKGLNPNAPMKDSGIEWIGEISEHWEVLPVKRALKIPICDGPHTTPTLLDEGIPFISAEAIKEGEVDFNKMRGFISQKDHKEFCRKYKPMVNDIYMVKSGATTGNLARNKNRNEFSIWSPLAVFRANTKYISAELLERVLSSRFFRKSVELKWSYGTQQNIGMGVLSCLPIIIPPLIEQKLIVKHIETQSTKITQAIDQAQQSIKTLKEYKATLINSAVTGKIKVTEMN